MQIWFRRCVSHLDVGEGDGGRARRHDREVEALHHSPSHIIESASKSPVRDIEMKVDSIVEGKTHSGVGIGDALESLQVSLCRAVSEILVRASVCVFLSTCRLLLKRIRLYVAPWRRRW